MRHPKADYFLYAKNHYKKSGNIWNDLKEIQGAYSGIDPEYILKGDILLSLLKLAYDSEVYQNEQRFIDFVFDIRKERRWLYSMDEVDLDTAIVRKCLGILMRTKVLNDEGDTILDLGDPDPNVLPLNKH